MRARLTLPFLLSIATLSCACAQTITPFQVQTASYTLHMFNHGNHAVNVAGLWMPGNISLIMRDADDQFVQYKSEDTPELRLAERRTEDGAEIIVIAGMLSERLRFTQTTRCEDLELTTTYEVEALADLTDTTIYMAAGPGPQDMLDGLAYTIASGDTQTPGTFPAAETVTVNNPERITWPGLGHRDVSWVFDDVAASKVIITDTGGRYEAHLLTRGQMAKGDVLRGSCSVQIEFEEGFTGIAPWSEATVGPIQFDVDGTTGSLHHLRTERGGIIERLNFNEKANGRNVYQSNAGQSMPGWSGIAELEPGEGEVYRVLAMGAGSTGLVQVTYERVAGDEPTALRLLVYLAQRFEDRGQPFHVRRATGEVIDALDGLATTVGMQPRDAEGGLGPYTNICQFAPGDEIVIPMLERGEIFTISCDQAATLAAYRFEVYFRGLWLDFTDDDAQDVTLTMQVAELPRVEGSDWFAPTGAGSDSFALNSGGMPLIDCVRPYQGDPSTSADPLTDDPTWQSEVSAANDGLRAHWRRVQADGPAGLVVDMPLELVGRTIGVIGPDGDGLPPPVWRRVGAELPAERLPAGSTLVVDRTASEELRMTVDFGCALTLRRKTGDGAQLVLAAPPDALHLGLNLAMTAVAPSPPQATQAGLRAEMAGADVVITSPWWQVRQSAVDGGCTSSVLFFYGDGRNLLTGPARSYITAANGSGTTIASPAKLDIVEQTPERVTVKATGAIAIAGASVPYVATTEYTTGYMRQRWEYDFGQGLPGVTVFGVQRMDVRPELDEYLGRRLSRRTSRGRAIFPGAALFEENTYSRYLCLFDRGVEGIEWLSASSVPQWRSQLGEPGHARYAIAASDDTPGAGSIIVEPWSDPASPITISGAKTFEWVTGLANIRPQLDRKYFVTALQAPGEEMVRHASEAGATVINLSADNWPGSFTSSDPRGAKRVVQLAHKYGMKIYPFDAHALLHRTVETVSAEQREEWGTERLDREGNRELWVYSSYGDYMCEESEGWREFMKQGFAGMMADYGYDGLYYDFVHPIVCYNDRHHPDSPHISTDGMLEICEWTAEQVGPDGVFSGHTGWVPTIACKNYCTIDTIYEEIGDDHVPSLGRMPEQAQFVNARPKRLVDSFLWNSCLGSGEKSSRRPRAEDMQAYTARCALIGVWPTPRTDDLAEAMQRPEDPKANAFVGLYSSLRGADLTTMEFADWRTQTAFTSDNAHLRAATFWNADQALVIVANSESAEQQAGTVRIDVTAFGWPENPQLSAAGLEVDLAGYTTTA